MGDWENDRAYRGDAGYSGRGSGNRYPSNEYRGGGRNYRGRGDGRNADGGGRFYSDEGYRGQRQDFHSQQYQTFDNGYRGGGGGYRGGGGRGRGGGRADWGRSHNQQNRQPRPPREEEQLPTDVTLAATLDAHEKVITALAFDTSTSQLYTASQDHMVKSWNSATGEMTSCVDVGGPVDALLVGGGYLFVGLHKGLDGIIKVWNMSSGSSHILTGHKGEVRSLLIGGANLFSSGQDATIRVWTFNQAAGIFIPQAIISADEGGHTQGVQAMVVQGPLMFSADQAGCIKVWDLSSGKCVQTLLGAHPMPIMKLLVFEGFLLSASLDGTIKCWQVVDPPGPDAVLRKEPEYVFAKDDDEGAESQQRRQRGGGGGSNRASRPGVLQMHGTRDAGGQPILLISYLGDTCIRLFDLPNFAARGALPQVEAARALTDVPLQAMITGDSRGQVKVFTWAMPGAAMVAS